MDEVSFFVGKEGGNQYPVKCMQQCMFNGYGTPREWRDKLLI